ncbi:MAG: cytochrome c [Candidatus Hydrogenedentes bacterium]|nr:cytochrome c [Candidatus Hydrogenedentota bacterium]
MSRLTLVLGVLLACASVQAQETAAYFKQNCMSCHTIGGGKLTGPDLKGVTERKDREWLTSFIVNPKAKVDSGDAYALQLLDEARGVVMPTIAGIDAEQAGFLLDLIEAESALEESQFKGIQISNEPFTQKDIDTGLAIFTGRQSLKNGGPACFSCHNAPGVGVLGGGRLDPVKADLTKVYERLQGRTVLSTWLMSPATPTMQSIFKNASLEKDEIYSLVAYFENSAQHGEVGQASAQLTFALFGIVGAALALVLFDVIWNGRFVAVRRPLVDSEKL